MSHNITALIGAAEPVIRLAESAGCPAPTELAFGLLLAPLGHDQLDALTQLNPGDYVSGFAYLSERLQQILLEASRDHALAYVETNYFGGTGAQAAAAFVRGEMVVRCATSVDREPVGHESPINTALRAIGVEAAPGLDEFDTLGLRQFRTLDCLGPEGWNDL